MAQPVIADQFCILYEVPEPDPISDLNTADYFTTKAEAVAFAREHDLPAFKVHIIDQGGLRATVVSLLEHRKFIGAKGLVADYSDGHERYTLRDSDYDYVV